MDQVLINLASLTIAGTGLFSVLTKFSVPELNETFWDANPYAVKRDIIEKIMTRLFTAFAITGLIISALGEIFGGSIPERTHTKEYYLVFFCIALIFAVLSLCFLSVIGRIWARKEWQPRIIKMQREAFEAAAYIVEHDGVRKEDSDESIAKQQKETNLNFARNCLVHIEKLLGFDSNLELSVRVQKLKPLFNKANDC